MVVDQGLVSTVNDAAVATAGFDHVLATRPRRDRVRGETLKAVDEGASWVEIP